MNGRMSRKLRKLANDKVIQKSFEQHYETILQQHQTKVGHWKAYISPLYRKLYLYLKTTYKRNRAIA